VSLEDKGSAVMIRDGSCALLQFRQAEDGSYASPPGYNLNLTKEPGQGWLLRSRTGMESRFDVDGALQSITDRNRNSITFRYSESDPGNRRLDQIVDRAGRTVTLSYGAARNGGIRLTAIEDFSGRRVTYDYDDEGRLAAATNAAGDRTSYTYFADAVYKNLLQSISTPGGSVTSFQYYGNGKVARVTLPGGQSMNFVYLPLRKETHVIDARGLLTSYHFNALGSVVRVLRPDGSSLDRVYSADAKLESQTDAAGNTSRYTYDEAGDMTSATDALGRTLRFTYHPEFHLLTSIEDAAGNITEFEYDARGNLIRSAQPLGVEERLTWDEVGNLISVTDAEGKSATIAYDGLGGPALVRDALGNETRLEFDRLRRLTKRIDAVGGEVSFEYDALDRVVKQLDPIGRVSSIAYDGDGRPVRTTDAGGRTAEFGYDSLNHLDRVTDASGAVTSYSYAAPDCACSATSNLRAVKDAAGVVRTQTYDEQDRLVASTDPLGNTTRFAYDVQGNLSSRTDANGAVTRFEYDAVGHLTRKVFADGSESRFAYDANNNLIRASNQHVTYTFTYDALNRLETFTDGRFGKTLRYAYDRLGRRTSLVDSEGGVFVYTWDANSRMEAVRNPSGSTAVFTHDALGRRSALAYSNGTGSTYQYDSAGRIASVVHGRRSNAVAAASTEPFSQFTLAYDDAGNAVSITDPSGTHRYTYDPVNRLTGAEHPSLPAESYSYNGAGDRVEAGNSYDAAGRLTASAGGVRYAHDRNGNLIRKTGPDGLTVYTWDHSNQLVQIELANGTVAKYKYDPLGRRIEKSVGGVTTAYLYDLSSILLELDSDGAMVARYTHGPGGVDLPVMMERGGQTYFYHQDGQANVTHVTDSAGNPACSYSYDSFGRIVTTSTAAASCQGSSVANPFAFAGREYDSESGLYHMRARYYDPSLGRFLSADPLDVANLLLAGQNRRAGLALLPSASAALVRYPGLQALRNPQQLNLYSYALNNPLAHRDPSGLTCGVYVMMGAEPHETGASGEPWIQGNINNFQAWLSANHYSLTYTEGAFAAIHDSSGNVVGVANASQAGFTETPYVAPPGFWAALPGAVSEVGQILSNKFEASLQVPWHQLSGQEYWDAANNPENYVNRGGSGGR
jgi:RHS repeat-associated protein